MDSKDIQAAASVQKALMETAAVQIKLLQQQMVAYKQAYEGLMRAVKLKEQAEIKKVMTSVQAIVANAQKLASQSYKMQTQSQTHAKTAEKSFKMIMAQIKG